MSEILSFGFRCSGSIKVQPSHSTSCANHETIADIIKFVNQIIARIARDWHLSVDEIADLRQEGYLAAIQADSSYDRNKASWRTWIAKRVKGQLKTSIARMRGLGITGDHGNIYPLSLDTTPPDDRGLDADDEDTTDFLTQVGAMDVQSPEVGAEIASAMGTLSKCLNSTDVSILSAYYGFDGKSLSVSELGERFGVSRKHAFTLLQHAQNSARVCLGSNSSVGVRNS